ncbi:hypothetical protein IQ269_06110 [Tychonema sp. LEGE 07199]|uniref:hypothetical protein n=1 Tax=Microcoleaceae TaxID=1892252 RepID=UPI00187E4FC6|nr:MULTISPECIES: hypothetical protein [unclassified Tychonema]MBE9120393.1 hypothetical protein [Tychonema sp. LEGE 07199]MBE9130445.1 hypothetical protein [Tychonema sp. LEGE 07196]MBE9163672.1 hypothetical protein [Tychonema sp. LEGE 06208]
MSNSLANNLNSYSSLATPSKKNRTWYLILHALAIAKLLYHFHKRVLQLVDITIAAVVLIIEQYGLFRTMQAVKDYEQ